MLLLVVVLLLLDLGVLDGARGAQQAEQTHPQHDVAAVLKMRTSPPGPPPQSSLQQQLEGGQALDPNKFIKPPVFPEEEPWTGSCRLRSKRYVSDGFCVSTRPVNEVVCAVSCMMNAWSKQTGTRALTWRCTDSGWKRQRVKLLCRDGTTRSHRIRTVQTCRCLPRARAGVANQLE